MTVDIRPTERCSTRARLPGPEASRTTTTRTTFRESPPTFSDDSWIRRRSECRPRRLADQPDEPVLLIETKGDEVLLGVPAPSAIGEVAPVFVT